MRRWHVTGCSYVDATFHRGQCVLLARMNASRMERTDNQIGKYDPLYRVVFVYYSFFFCCFCQTEQCDKFAQATRMSIVCRWVNVIEYLDTSLLIGLRVLNFANLMDSLLHKLPVFAEISKYTWFYIFNVK